MNRPEQLPDLRSPWSSELKGRFEELLSLPKGWDGYAGGPVSFACVRFAVNLIDSLYIDGIPAPQLVPGSDGTLQFEWHVNQIDLEVDVLGSGNVVAYLSNHRTGEEQEIELQTDFSELTMWVSQLARTGEHERVQVRA